MEAIESGGRLIACRHHERNAVHQISHSGTAKDGARAGDGEASSFSSRLHIQILDIHKEHICHDCKFGVELLFFGEAEAPREARRRICSHDIYALYVYPISEYVMFTEITLV